LFIFYCFGLKQSALNIWYVKMGKHISFLHHI